MYKEENDVQDWEWLVLFAFIVLCIVLGYITWVDRNRRDD